jgi:Protein of unknown function (DUF1214)
VTSPPGCGTRTSALRATAAWSWPLLTSTLSPSVILSRTGPCGAPCRVPGLGGMHFGTGQDGKPRDLDLGTGEVIDINDCDASSSTCTPIRSRTSACLPAQGMAAPMPSSVPAGTAPSRKASSASMSPRQMPGCSYGPGEGASRARSGTTTTALAGTRSYEIRFPAEDLPPRGSGGFWSITLYNAAGFLVANPIDRYSIGDETHGLVGGADRSLTVVVSASRPGETEVNWLPSPKGAFGLVLRGYDPMPQVLDGFWSRPVIPAIS